MGCAEGGLDGLEVGLAVEESWATAKTMSSVSSYDPAEQELTLPLYRKSEYKQEEKNVSKVENSTSNDIKRTWYFKTTIPLTDAYSLKTSRSKSNLSFDRLNSSSSRFERTYECPGWVGHCSIGIIEVRGICRSTPSVDSRIYLNSGSFLKDASTNDRDFDPVDRFITVISAWRLRIRA
jgi:hypothetical protein